MIGVIGPHDSARRVVETAEEIDFGPVIARAYDDPLLARQVAQELAALCRVLVFTGEYPYQLTRMEWQARASTELTYIQHTAADLYRTIARLLVAQSGYARDCPTLVVDVIDEATIRGVVADVGLAADFVRLASWQDADAPLDLEELAARHVAAHEESDDRLSLTCFGAVYENLRGRGIPCTRIEHTHSAITDALRQAKVVDVALEARERQAAVIIAQTPDGSATERRIRATFPAQVISRDGEGRLAVHTTRLLGQAALATLLPEHPPAGEPDRFGVGIAESSHDAYIQAAAALAYATAYDLVESTFENGTPTELFEQHPEAADALASAANAVGLAPLTLYRLLAAFRTVNPDQFTVHELADAYGATTRTVRRLVTRLREHGLVEQAGMSRAPGAGRPSPVYRIDPGDLLP